MYDRFGYPGLFGAYNAGPGAYSAWLAGNRRLPRETVAYLDSVGCTAQPVSPASQSRVPPALFVVRSEEHTSELQSLMRISYAVFCLKHNIQKQKESRLTLINH